ncbi:MAG: AEC family transporter [Lachnospiraceae bacterium]|jgi:predicted permease|nr:AEC family transporter [Lachnospiraceae bacterium]
MELTLITIEKIVEMFLILFAGVIASRVDIIDHQTNKRLSGLLLQVICPAMLFMSYQIEFRQERFLGLVLTAALGVASMAAAIVVIQFLVPDKGRANAEIERLSAIYSNCGFIGIPLINGILGSEGVFYITAYITVFNLIIWSHGLALMTGSADIKTVVRQFIQPATIAIGLGIVCFLARIQVPSIVAEPMKMVGDMNTPLAMLVAGCNLAESNLLSALKRPRTYWISFLKLLAEPLLALLILAFVPVNLMVKLAVLVASACPTCAMGTMFALQYNRDSNYASELFAITTLLSLFTIPLVVFLGNVVL